MLTHLASRCGFGLILRGHLFRNEDINQSSLARRLGRPESTLRSWLNDNKSPDLDWVIENSHLLPDDVLVHTINAIGGGRYLATPVESEVMEGVCIRTESIDIAAKTVEMVREIDRHMADDFYSHEEAEVIDHRATVVIRGWQSIRTRARSMAGRTVRTLARRRA